MKTVCTESLLFAGALLVGLAGCANTAEKSGMCMDESLITTKVKAEMVTDKEVKAHNITVNTIGGGVTLAGTVATIHESEEAAQTAQAGARA